MAEIHQLPRRCLTNARVESVDHICREHVLVDLVVTEFPDSVPGQFLELQCNFPFHGEAAAHDWDLASPPRLSDPSWIGREPYLRRPFSIGDRWSDDHGRTHLSVISRRIGPGTAFLDALAAGDSLSVTGPLGRGFTIPADGRSLVLVGGGVGIPPLIYLARVLAALRRADVTVIFGALAGDLLPVRCVLPPPTDPTPTGCLVLPGAPAFPALVTTDDGSLGICGRVTDALTALAARRPAGPPPLVFACGPDGMLHAVARLTRRLGWDCELCIERNMGCGLGTCLSCVTRVFDRAREAGWRWALACSEGPVFERDRLVEYADSAKT
jgi:dihydroorotate dehydrogenase electron transfer subunit